MITRDRLALTARWLVLVVAGWLGYALTRAAVAVSGLGAPIYDWQWYLPLTALATVLPAALAWRPDLRHSRGIWLAAASALAWLLAGYGGFGARETLQVAGTPPLRLSFWAYGDLQSLPTTVLRDIHASRGTVYVDTSCCLSDVARRHDLTRGLQRLAGYGVEAILMPPAGGDFLSVPTVDAWAASAISATELVVTRGITNVAGLIGDVEPPRLTAWLDLSGNGSDEVAAAADALNMLRGTVKRTAPGMRVGVTGLWPHYLDRADGDADLAITLRSPLDPPGAWDFVNLMTYSSYLPPDERAYYVLALERAFARRYPQTPRSHLIGLVGGGFPGEPVLGFDDLARDAQISRALNVQEVVVFQLDGALRVFGEDFVARLNAAVNGPAAQSVSVRFSRPAALALYGYAVADALLDARGPRGLVGLAVAALGAYALLVRRDRSGHMT